MRSSLGFVFVLSCFEVMCLIELPTFKNCWCVEWDTFPLVGARAMVGCCVQVWLWWGCSSVVPCRSVTWDWHCWRFQGSCWAKSAGVYNSVRVIGVFDGKLFWGYSGKVMDKAIFLVIGSSLWMHSRWYRCQCGMHGTHGGVMELTSRAQVPTKRPEFQNPVSQGHQHRCPAPTLATMHTAEVPVE